MNPSKESSMILYVVSDGPPSLAVGMVLKALEVPYVQKQVDFLAGEHLTPAFAQMNPQRELPVLDDNGFYLSESVAIIEYICEKFESKSMSWYPKEPKIRARIKQRLCFNLSSYYPAILAYVVAPIFYNYERTELGLRKVHHVLTILDAYLRESTHNYVANTMTPSIADICLMASTLCLEVIDYNLSSYSNVAKWYSDFKIQQPELWSIANRGMQELIEFNRNRPDMSHIHHPIHPVRKAIAN